MHRVTRFGVIQTANMIGALYFALGVVGALLFALMRSAIEGMGGMGGMGGMESQGAAFGVMSGMFLFLAPLFYGALGWVATAIGCLFYNLVGRFVGGIAVELETVAD